MVAANHSKSLELVLFSSPAAKCPTPYPEPMRGSATAASSTNGSAGKTVSGQAHYSHRRPTHSAVTFTPLRCCARLRHRQCLAARHCRRVRGRIQLAALVSGIVVPPQPDPDVTQARCSSRRMPRNAVALLDTLADCALLALHCFHCTAQCSHCARGYRRCSPLTHSFRCRRSTLPCLRCTAHRHRHNTKSPQN